MKLNAGEILDSYRESINPNYSSLNKEERKMYESISSNPGISRDVLAVKYGDSRTNTERVLFSLTKKGMVHIRTGNFIYPVV